LPFDNGLPFSFAQVKGENIGSEVVNVVKPSYACHFGCFKVPETPVLDDEGNAKKKH
jgi:hypothetical protein